MIDECTLTSAGRNTQSGTYPSTDIRIKIVWWSINKKNIKIPMVKFKFIIDRICSRTWKKTRIRVWTWKWTKIKLKLGVVRNRTWNRKIKLGGSNVVWFFIILSRRKFHRIFQKFRKIFRTIFRKSCNLIGWQNFSNRVSDSLIELLIRHELFENFFHKI